jgi:hypothetical protein
LKGNERDNAEITSAIIRLIRDKEPETMQQLVELIKGRFSIPESKILDIIHQLQEQGKIILKNKSPVLPDQLRGYLTTKKVHWYFGILIFIVMTTILVFVIPENYFPLVYLRYLLGAILVLFLPGYSFLKAVFPKTMTMNESTLGLIEIISLSIGVSIAFVPLIGIFLIFTELGINLPAIVSSLLFFEVLFSTVALIRDYRYNVGKK